MAGTKLTLIFDEELDAGSAPAGRRFRVIADHPYKRRRLIYGTGAARVSGKTVGYQPTLGTEMGEILVPVCCHGPGYYRIRMRARRSGRPT